MKRVSILLAWGIVAIVAGLAALNWPTLMAEAPLDLVVAQIQAPLGVVLLGITGLLVALFFIAFLRIQIDSLLENRRLLKDVQRVQELADKAEASRIEKLHQLITTEFRQLNQQLNERLRAVAVVPAPTDAGTEARPYAFGEVAASRVQA